MGNFKEAFKDCKGVLDALPLFHNCDGYEFRSITSLSNLVIKDCDVFAPEKLIYCFYGKPSYRPKYSPGVFSNPAFFPVSFIFNSNSLSSPHKLYPFDTGAFTQLPEVKDKYFHPSMLREDFLLDSSLRSAKEVIEYFYNTNKSYFEAQPSRKPNEIPAKLLEAISYCSMINETSSTSYDDRLSSIEFIFNEDIPINSKNLINVVLPSDFYADSSIREILNDKWGVTKPLVYNTVRGNPLEYHALVYDRVRQYLTDHNYI